MSQKIKSKSKLLIFTHCFGLFITSLYVIQVNKISTKGYTLKLLQEERDELIEKQEELNLKISKAQGLDLLSNDINIKKMSKFSGEIIYLDSNTQLASK